MSKPGDGSARRITAEDIKAYLTGFYGRLDADEGILFGRPDTPVRKIMVCWMAEMDAITYAVSRRADAILCHEILFYPSDVLHTGSAPDFLSWPVNQARISALAKGGLTVIRGHMTVDRVCVLDDFAAKLGLGEPVCRRPDLVYAYQGGRTVSDYLELVKTAFGMRHVRHTARDLGRTVQRIGLPWGGLGISRNVRYMEQLAELGCDLFIAGETENYAMRFARDSGIDMIETGHELSENPGLRHFADMLAASFPQLEVIFYENPQSFIYA